MLRYSPPNLKVWAPRVQVRASASEIERGLKRLPLVEALLVARISRPLRAMPVEPRASIDWDVTVPDNETCVGSYPAGPKATASYFGRLYPTLSSLTQLERRIDWWLATALTGVWVARTRREVTVRSGVSTEPSL